MFRKADTNTIVPENNVVVQKSIFVSRNKGHRPVMRHDANILVHFIDDICPCNFCPQILQFR